MKKKMRSRVAKGIIVIVCGIVAVANAELTHEATQKEINVALSKWGATATASSEFAMNCQAEKALDGKWSLRDTDKWTSAHNKAPHWLRIDLGDNYEINRAVIRHEGACGEGREYNTSDYRLQRSDLPDGPWMDLVEPVRGNAQDVTRHEFTPVRTRYVRLFIENAEQNSNQCARVFEIEIYVPTSRINKSLLILEFPDKKFRKKHGRLETSARVDYILAKDLNVEPARFFLKFADTQIEVSGERPRVWLPATGEPLDVILLAKTADGEAELAGTKVVAPIPNYFSEGGTVHLMSSSHQDIAWMDSPQFCRVWRDQHNVTPALELMQTNKDYRFTVENMMYLMDELEDHPERRPQVHQYTREGLLEWGATYTQPYESMLSGEQLVRGMYLGRKWLHKTFPDCDALAAWSPDVPGRAMQMPQILSKAGIPYLMFSRHEPGLYNWESPDGSGVIAYTPGQYCESGRQIFMVEAQDGAREVHRRLDADSDYFRKHQISPNYPLLRSWDFSPATVLPELISAIVSHEEGQAGGDEDSNTAAGLKVRYSSSREFFESIKDSKPSLKKIVGERPNPWLYIHGPSHHWAISASREAGILLPAAEMFSTIQCILDGSFEAYPTAEFFGSWKAACFPDHGWGGNQGEITDNLFKEKLEYARDKAQQLLDRSVHAIASHVKTDEAKGTPLVVFNTLSWPRSGMVNAEVPGLTGEIHVADSGGHVVPHQILSAHEKDKNQVLFIAKEVPATGYKTYYVVPGRKDATPEKPSGTQDVVDNRFYALRLTEGGVCSIYDKQLKREILRPDKFLGGEIFTMQSVGNGAGEFADVQQPSMEGFDKVSRHRPKWTFNESETGPVQTVWNLRQKLKHCTVEQTLRLYNDIKKIDFEVSLLDWDGTRSREFRMALPVNVDQAKIAYEVAMGVLEVGRDEIEGAAGERYLTPCKDVHPREVLNFMTAGNHDFGVTMSSSVAVFDWMDPTTDPSGSPVLQPILLASRKSCHSLGNWYVQAGDHHYRFSVLSHKADWKNGYRFGIESNTPLRAITGVKPGSNASLPEEKSFFEVSADNVVVSTIKKCDDDDSVIVRLYDIEGKDSEITFNAFFPILAVEHTNIIEEEGKAIPGLGTVFKTKIGHHAIETFKLIPGEVK